MTITLVYYSYIEPGGAPPRMLERTTTPLVLDYLTAHVDELIRRAGTEVLSPAQFRSEPARTRFAHLASGTRDQFVRSSQDLADRLHARMDNRAKRGFIVTLRLRGPQGSAALKLDVSDAAAAALRTNPGGEPTLEAIQDLLDLPGQLQKGAVAPDSRPDSDVVVGDKLTVTSQYFLEALDVQQHVAAGPATADLLTVIQAIAPTKASAAAAAIERATRTTVRDFLRRQRNFTDEERENILASATVRTRPIDLIDPTSYALREEISADGITVRGRSEVMRERVRIVRRPGGFRIEIDVSESPRRRFV